MLLAIAIDPFSQQLIQIRSEIHFRPWINPAVAYVLDYSSGSSMATGKKGPVWGSKININKYGPDIDPSLEGQILDGLFNNSTKAKDGANMGCPTAYCRWDEFVTAGICYKCNTITSQLAIYKNWAIFDLDQNYSTGGPFNISAYFLPNGAFLDNANGAGAGPFGTTDQNYREVIALVQMMGYATGNPHETVSMKNLTTLFWSLSAVYLDLVATDDANGNTYDEYPNWPNWPVVAKECALYYCGLKVSSKYENNTLVETTREANLTRNPGSWQLYGQSRFPDIPPDALNSLEFDPETGVLSRTDLTLMDSTNRTVVSFNDEAVFSISNYLQSAFQTTSNLTLRSSGGLEEAHGSVTLSSPNFPQGKANIACYTNLNMPVKGAGIWGGYMKNRIDPEPQFKALAEAMTISMRNSGQDEPTVFAEIGEAVTVYHVQWAWIALHAVIVSGSIVFFILTVLRSSKAQKVSSCWPWKNSSLAIISKAAELGPLFDPKDTIPELQEKARGKTGTFSSEQAEFQDPSRSREQHQSDSLSG